MKQYYSMKWFTSSTWKENFQRIFLLIIATLLLVIGNYYPFGSEYLSLREGTISSIEVVAPFDFEILKDPEILSQERYEARKNSPPVLEYNDSISKYTTHRSQKITIYLRSTLPQSLRKNEEQKQKFVNDVIEYLNNDMQYSMDVNDLNWMLRKFQENEKSMLDALDRWQMLSDKIVAQGVVGSISESKHSKVTTLKEGVSTLYDYSLLLSLDTITEELLALLREQEPSEDFIRVGYNFLRPLIQPNWFYNDKATQSLRDAAAQAIPSGQGIVLKGEKIVDRGKRIDKNTLQILKSLIQKREEISSSQGTWGSILPQVGKIVLVFAILSLWLFVILSFRNAHEKGLNYPILSLLLIVIPMLILIYVVTPNDVSVFYFPVAAFLIAITIVFGIEIALFATAIFMGLSVIMGQGSTSLMLFTMLSAWVGIIFMNSITSRSQLFRAVPIILLVTSIVTLSKVFSDTQWSTESTHDIFAGVIAAFANPLLAFGLVVGIEKMFRVTTDLTYLELADFNRPILRKLALEAPGTFHHSVLVGALAETAARAVSANPILARCAAYYHDIGKLEIKDYFIENQSSIENPHNELKPEDSVELLKKHVSLGIEAANALKLPEEVIQGIPEHHGTCVMNYFYQKARINSSENLTDWSFRYDGPKPNSKETAILMLADSCEAISRTLKNPSQLEIKRAIKEIIDEKVLDKQLENSPLTFEDLKKIENAFLTVLDGILHKRIIYPQNKVNSLPS